MSELLRKRGQVKEEIVGGKKEMIIRLDSIEEESMLVDENNASHGQQQYSPTQKFGMTNTTFKSKQKDNTHKEIMRRFNDDFEQLEEKFKNF